MERILSGNVGIATFIQCTHAREQINSKRSFDETQIHLVSGGFYSCCGCLLCRVHLSRQGNALADNDSRSKDDRQADDHAQSTLDLGRQIFRFDTFGDEVWWGDTLRLHQALAGAKSGGVGPGVSPKTALAVGLKVDADALPGQLKSQIRAGRVNLDDPATTLALLKLNAVVGVTGIFDGAGNIKSMGVQCALCHSTVDDSFAPGIGKRLDGWANRDLNVGLIVSLAPNLTPIADLLQGDVNKSWGFIARKKGEMPYICRLHPAMKGVLVVK